MNPNDLPAFAGAVNGGGNGDKPLPPGVDSLKRWASDMEVSANGRLAELRDSIVAVAKSAEDAADTGIGTLYVDYQNKAVASAKKAIKGTDVLYKLARDVAADAESRAHAGYHALGGAPYLMTEEAFGVNQANAHDSEAVYRLIQPAIEQQVRGEQPGAVPPASVSALGAGARCIEPDPVTGEPREVPCPPQQPTDLPPSPPDSPVAPPPAVPPPPQTTPPVAPPVAPSPPVACDPCGRVDVKVIVNGVECPPKCDATSPPVPPTSPTPTPPVVPPPTPPVVPPPTPGIHPVGTFDGSDLCQKLATAITVGQGGGGEYSSALGHPAWMQAAHAAKDIPIIGPIIELVVGLVGTQIKNINADVIEKTGQIGIPNPAMAVTSSLGTLVFSLLDRWAGTNTTYYSQPIDQAAHYANPLNLLSQGSADDAYLNGGLTREQWECVTRSNGNMPWQHWQACYAKRAKLSDDQLVRLRMRGKITDAQYQQAMRENGYLDRSGPDGLMALSDYIPTTAELFTWLKKDVYDDKFAARYGLDEDFPDITQEPWKTWFAANGTTPEQVKYDFRSQWRLPSTTQLAELVARNRPGRVDPSLTITPADADQLLKLDEWPARMRGLILSTLTQPVNRTDLIEAFKAGTMKEAELTERLKDLRYSQADAEFLTRMIVAKATGQLQSSMGGWTRLRVVKEYIAGTLPEETARTLLSRTILDPAAVQMAIEDADAIRAAEKRRLCIKGIRRRYFTGEIDSGESRFDLLAQGVDHLTVGTIIGGWECERASRSKEPTVKMLKEWLGAEIISADEMFRRLRNLGYTSADATRIVNAAGMAEAKKRAKEEESAARKAAADARRRIKELEAALKKATGK